MSDYIPIGQHQVTVFVDAKAQIEAAARELFDAYIKALPDKADWHGYYGWRVGSEHLEITIDAKGIEYHTEYTSHGDTESFYLNLPLSALYDPNFLADEKVRLDHVKKEKQVRELKEKEDAEKRKHEEDRKRYEQLMKQFDPEIYERLKHTENQS